MLWRRQLGVLVVDTVELAQLEHGPCPAHRASLLILVGGHALRDSLSRGPSR
jgi:hypothetical protein